jgi:hypothetical protein
MWQEVQSDKKGDIVGYSLESFDDESSARSYADEVGFLSLIGHDAENQLDPHSHVDASVLQPYAPVISDLARLHWLVVSRRVPSVLEFGSGYSTLVLGHAMRTLAVSTPPEQAALFRQNPLFHVHSVDEDQRFADIARSRIPADIAAHVTITCSAVEMATFLDRVCTAYTSVPDVSPGLVYVDGPSQFAASGSVRGYSTRRGDAFPMAMDVLAIEHFLAPGALVVVDGRAANARFLRANLQRDWAYEYRLGDGMRADIHLFELQEAPLGVLNQRQLEFCLPNGFLIRP